MREERLMALKGRLDERERLLEEIQRLLERAGNRELDLTWRFLKGMVSAA